MIVTTPPSCNSRNGDDDKYDDDKYLHERKFA
jgi:hypothetical protein